jgi:hypothetical protein
MWRSRNSPICEACHGFTSANAVLAVHCHRAPAVIARFPSRGRQWTDAATDAATWRPISARWNCSQTIDLRRQPLPTIGRRVHTEAITGKPSWLSTPGRQAPQELRSGDPCDEIPPGSEPSLAIVKIQAVVVGHNVEPGRVRWDHDPYGKQSVVPAIEPETLRH